MIRSSKKYRDRSNAIQAKLNRRALSGFYYLSRQFISRRAQINKHICLSNTGTYPLLDGTPILQSSKFNQLSLKVADMYPSDDEFDGVNDSDMSSNEDNSSDEDCDDDIQKVMKNINDKSDKGAFEVTNIEYNQEDGDDDEDFTFTDSKNEYKIETDKPISTATIIRPKKNLRNSSCIRSDEYMAKYDDIDTWVDMFL